MLKEFKDFISRGSVIDMAVGVIIGGALTALVSSLTKNLLNPLIGMFVGKIDLSGLKLSIGSATFKYGTFLNDIITFLIVSFIVFIIVKAVNTFRKKEEEAPAKPTPTEEYLLEIRDLLKAQNK